MIDCAIAATTDGARRVAFFMPSLRRSPTIDIDRLPRPDVTFHGGDPARGAKARADRRGSRRERGETRRNRTRVRGRVLLLAPRRPAGRKRGDGSMNLYVWLPAMFVLGLAGMGICLAFVTACERI